MRRLTHAQRDWFGTAIGVCGLIVIFCLIAFGFWAHFAGPCWLYNFSAAGDIPGRCVMP